ncbi:hypothetical protein ACFL0E_00485 [Nanoarchaeota archaeon]
MEIKDIQANQGNLDLVLIVKEKESERTFEKFGKTGRVCKATVSDDSGEVKLTLWNEDIDKVTVGDKIHLKNGWCSEYQGEKQISSGKFGTIELLENSSTENKESSSESDTKEEAEAPTEEPVEVLTNAVPEEPQEEESEPVTEEELIE